MVCNVRRNVFLHFDVRRTMEWVDMWALFTTLCLLRVHAVIRTDNLRVVWAVGSGGPFFFCTKSNDVDWWTSTWAGSVGTHVRTRMVA